MDSRRFDQHFNRIYRDHMPHEAQRIKNRYMAVWQIPNMEKMTFCMSDIVNRRILDGPFDAKETRLLARQMGLSLSDFNPFLDTFVARLESEIRADSIRHDTIMYRGEARPDKVAHSLAIGSIHHVKSFSSFSALPSTGLAFSQSPFPRQSTLFRVLMHRGAPCAYIKNAMTVRDPKACDVIFNEFEYLVAPNMSYKVIDVTRMSLGIKDVLVVSMISLATPERAHTGDMGTLARMDHDSKWSQFRRALDAQVIEEQQVWNTLQPLQVDYRIWSNLFLTANTYCSMGNPSGKSSHLLGRPTDELAALARTVRRLDANRAKLVGKKLGYGKVEWKECKDQDWPVPVMVHDVLHAVAIARPLALRQPLTLYVQMPVWWYRWDKPNPVYGDLMQTGRFTIDVPLLAEFSPHRQLWTSYMNLGQEPPLIACAGTRPVRENHRTIFCLTFTTIRGIMPTQVFIPFQKRIVLLPPLDCLYVRSNSVVNGAGQTIEMRHIRVVE